MNNPFLTICALVYLIFIIITFIITIIMIIYDTLIYINSYISTNKIKICNKTIY